MSGGQKRIKLHKTDLYCVGCRHEDAAECRERREITEGRLASSGRECGCPCHRMKLKIDELERDRATLLGVAEDARQGSGTTDSEGRPSMSEWPDDRMEKKQNGFDEAQLMYREMLRRIAEAAGVAPEAGAHNPEIIVKRVRDLAEHSRVLHWWTVMNHFHVCRLFCASSKAESWTFGFRSDRDGRFHVLSENRPSAVDALVAAREKAMETDPPENSGG